MSYCDSDSGSENESERSYNIENFDFEEFIYKEYGGSNEVARRITAINKMGNGSTIENLSNYKLLCKFLETYKAGTRYTYIGQILSFMLKVNNKYLETFDEAYIDKVKSLRETCNKDKKESYKKSKNKDKNKSNKCVSPASTVDDDKTNIHNFKNELDEAFDVCAQKYGNRLDKDHKTLYLEYLNERIHVTRYLIKYYGTKDDQNKVGILTNFLLDANNTESLEELFLNSQI